MFYDSYDTTDSRRVNIRLFVCNLHFTVQPAYCVKGYSIEVIHKTIPLCNCCLPMNVNFGMGISDLERNREKKHQFKGTISLER